MTAVHLEALPLPDGQKGDACLPRARVRFYPQNERNVALLLILLPVFEVLNRKHKLDVLRHILRGTLFEGGSWDKHIGRRILPSGMSVDACVAEEDPVHDDQEREKRCEAMLTSAKAELKAALYAGNPPDRLRLRLDVLDCVLETLRTLIDATPSESKRGNLCAEAAEWVDHHTRRYGEPDDLEIRVLALGFLESIGQRPENRSRLTEAVNAIVYGTVEWLRVRPVLRYCYRELDPNRLRAESLRRALVHWLSLVDGPPVELSPDEEQLLRLLKMLFEPGYERRTRARDAFITLCAHWSFVQIAREILRPLFRPRMFSLLAHRYQQESLLQVAYALRGSGMDATAVTELFVRTYGAARFQAFVVGVLN